MKETVDAAVIQGMTGEPYDWNRDDDLLYSAWLIGRRLAGKPPLKSIILKQNGSAPTVSLHPANWR